MRKPKKVLIALETPHAAARQKMRGIFRYVAEGHDWDVRLIRSRSELTAATIRSAENDGTDGYILSIPDAAEALSLLSGCTQPIAAIELDHHFFGKRQHVCHLRTDNAGIGRFAAERFLAYGYFRSFAVVADFRNRSWSQARSSAFLETLAKANRGKDAFAFADTSDKRLERLADFLVRLPRPAAVFVTWDIGAAEVLSVCRSCRLAVPKSVSIIGVDNDDFICESTSPALSTILVDRESQGYAAAQALDVLMHGRRRPSAPVCRVVRFVERESTTPLSPSGPIVDRAGQFIAENAIRGISVNDVAAHLGISRRLLDLRFRELGVPPVAAAIRNAQLAEVRRLLESTSLDDKHIAERSGFDNVNSLRNLFRRTYGQTMRAYCRKQKHTGLKPPSKKVHHAKSTRSHTRSMAGESVSSCRNLRR